MNPNNPNVKLEQTDAEAGAKKLGLETVTLNARNAPEIDAAFEQLLSVGAHGFITATDPILLDRREQIVSFAHRHKLPAVYFVRQFAAVGGLLSYGPSISWMYRQAGLRGSKLSPQCSQMLACIFLLAAVSTISIVSPSLSSFGAPWSWSAAGLLLSGPGGGSHRWGNHSCSPLPIKGGVFSLTSS